MSLEVVFENRDLVVADKPHGWLSTPSRDAAEARPCLGLELQARAGQQIFPIHRLDFEVSGLLMFAKTKEAHREAQAWFETSRVSKVYEAFSRPGPGDHSQWADWVSRLAKGKRRAFEAAHGKESRTRARKKDGEGDCWRWELMPLTGRSHQLRFEMAKRGFPILGDTLYGGEPIPSCPQWIGLRAVMLDFTALPDSGRFGLPQVLGVGGLLFPPSSP